MIEQITAILNENIGRVDNLISLYGPETPGRKTVHETDILRGALVLLHAGMEDYLRSLMVWKIDTYSAETLNAFGFPNGSKRPPQKVTLGDLSAYRGKSVDELISYAVKYHLEEFQSFNDRGEVKKALKQCGVSSQAIEAHNFDKLSEMIERRHNIVHKGDRNNVMSGQGNHSTKSLRKQTVKAYVEAVHLLERLVSVELTGVV